MLRHARSMLTLGAALCLAVPLSAQQGAPATAEAVPAAAMTESTLPAAGPTLAGEQVGVRATTATESAPLVLQDSRTRSNVTWMIVGGAALIIGSLVDGDAGTIIMVTGAVIGLVGLFRYLR